VNPTCCIFGFIVIFFFSFLLFLLPYYTTKKKEKEELLTLLKRRNVQHLLLFNAFPYAEAYAIRAGVPANTIILIMLLPLLATLIVAVRYIIGLTSMGLLVPIALSITLLATGIVPGLVMLVTILLASWIARLLLKKVRIMQMPKMALSMFVVAIFLFISLMVSANYRLFDVENISIFPILLLILLSDRVVAIFLERNAQETIEIICVTLILSMIGFMLFSWNGLRNTLLVYPELVLLVVPLNVLIGRYFGLRFTEYIKFQPVLKKG
jgi:hypothetical protein